MCIAWFEQSKVQCLIKEIADLCGIKKNLTTHLARHALATQVLLQNIPLRDILAMLGHSKLNITPIHLFKRKNP
ncbi:tyrosine-type recombinase/integrase [Flagellimonas oceanensis]|uniref:tyrosine-type recombinase/integrase n=1 Tax=Flagellimonas oceanensis TaxID=2499163 RepID=UPI000F8E51A6